MPDPAAPSGPAAPEPAAPSGPAASPPGPAASAAKLGESDRSGVDIPQVRNRPSQIWPEPTDDRRRAGTARTLTIAALLAIGFRFAVGTLPVSGRSTAFIDVAAGTALIAIVVLRSVPLRWIARSYALISGVLMLRFGWLTEEPGVASAQDVILWTVATVGAR